MFLIIFLLSVLTSSWCLTNISKEGNFYETDGPYFVSQGAVNWTDAKQSCKNVGLELASVISEDEQSALELFIIKSGLSPVDKWSGYWLSGKRHEDGNYYWDSTGTKVGETFRGWAWGEPSHAYGREDCVELKGEYIFLRWNDYFCDETRRYICEIPRKLKTQDVKKKLKKQFLKKEWREPAEDYGIAKPVDNKESDDLENREDVTWYPPSDLYSKDDIESDTTRVFDEDLYYYTPTELSPTE